MRKTLAILLALVMILAFVGCSSSDSSKDSANNSKDTDNSGEFTAKAPSEIVVCYSIKGQNSWLEEQGRGAIEACEKLGIPKPTIVYNQDQADAASQSRAIEDMVALDPDVIIVDPTSATVLSTVLQNAADSGIIIIETDTCGDLDMVTASVGLDEYEAAYEQGKTLCAELSAGDAVVIIAGQQGDNNAESRLKGQQDACKDAGIEVLDHRYTNWSADESAAAMEDLITRFSGEFQGVLTPSDDMTCACITALEQAGIIDDVLVAGYGGFQIAVDAINAGTMFLTVGMKPYQCGYQAVEITHDILVNNKYPAEKWVNVGADIITKDNVSTWKGF
ncbi:MAG: sugar ABC transporter substrate-binding protein [Christensenellales bacterium]|jgi:ribose transport system substrate-binding protein